MKLSAQIGTQERDVVVEAVSDGKFRVVIDGAERIVDARRLGPGTWSILVGDQALTVDVEPGKDFDLNVDVRGTVVPVKLVDPRRKLFAAAQARTAKVHAGPIPVTSPMPGKVVKVLVKIGEAVTAGQCVAVVEAMKMEN